MPTEAQIEAGLDAAMASAAYSTFWSRKDMRVLISAALTAAEAAAWQPIETAPKDGRAVLLLSKGYTDEHDGEKIVHKPRCNIGKWNPEGDSWVDEHGQLSDDCYHHLEVTGVWDSGGGWFQPNEVTHWRPLPQPPGEME